MTPKEEFIEIYTKYITRNGADELLEWLKRTDFFTAPASTKYHCACEGGLVMHSVSVFNTMMEKHYDEETDNIESFAICGLLHDLCKAQFYKVSSRNVKNEQTGAWEKVPYYAIDDQFPYGHGEKSVFLIERKMHLKIDEAMAIRWSGSWGGRNCTNPVWHGVGAYGSGAAFWNIICHPNLACGYSDGDSYWSSDRTFDSGFPRGGSAAEAV